MFNVAFLYAYIYPKWVQKSASYQNYAAKLRRPQTIFLSIHQMSHTNTIKKMWKLIKQWTKSYVCPDAANETLEILVSGSYLVQKQHLVNSSKTLSLPPPARRRALGEQRVQRVGHVHLVLRRLDLLHRRHDGRQRCRRRLLQARQVVKIKGPRLLIIVITSPSCSGKVDFSWTTSWWWSGQSWWAPQRPLEAITCWSWEGATSHWHRPSSPSPP